ncbi:hypothetical protein B586_08065 [Mycobacterium haemophilum DSM 44634]|nr:hypothetical protein B586_08065 [Mycobacterium haemophilum DSM 44634]
MQRSNADELGLSNVFRVTFSCSLKPVARSNPQRHTGRVKEPIAGRALTTNPAWISAPVAVSNVGKPIKTATSMAADQTMATSFARIVLTCW